MTQKRNGNILCAQIATKIHGKDAMILCRNAVVHVELFSGASYLLTNLENWRDMNLSVLQHNIEHEISRIESF